ncbi:NADH:(hydroxy)cinnamate reductase subunit CrdA-like [Watersipora subatra]|uniref:NADH:(hydroxy)cinnamate reductase subunit CrdA-like n=1 Tax=Watersipora subatra TaxID=2589382 RepID=UPI00355B6F4B
MSATGLRACLLLGSAREPRLATRVLTFVTSEMKRRGWECDIVDPLEVNLPVLQTPVFFYKNPDDVPPVLNDIAAKIKAADAFVIITCEYNNCLPPGLLNTIAHFSPFAYSKRTSSIICYSAGMYGGIRAAMQGRCLLGEINTVSIPNVFGMPKVQDTLTEDGKPLDDHLVSGAEKHLNELEWYTRALKVARDSDASL